MSPGWAVGARRAKPAGATPSNGHKRGVTLSLSPEALVGSVHPRKAPKIPWRFLSLPETVGNGLEVDGADGSEPGAPSSATTSAVCCASNPLFQWVFTDPLPFFLSSRAGLRRFHSQIAAKPLHFPCPAEFSDSLIRNPWNLSDFGVCRSPLPAPGAFRMILPALCAVFGGLSGV